MPGFPIRTPWDHSLVDSSPRPIAASHVLHRLLVPRHPPSALDNLTTKMLASTVQFSTNDQPHNPHPPRPTPHPSHHHPRAVQEETGGQARVGPCLATREAQAACLFPQDPTGCPPLHHHPRPARPPPPTGSRAVQSKGQRRRKASTKTFEENLPRLPHPHRRPLAGPGWWGSAAP